MYRIFADENIAFAKEAFSEFGEVNLLPGREISNKNLIHADILLVRSVTKVDQYLLNGTQVKFVGTATIGTDHVDKAYLAASGIIFADAAGCNSDAVKEYVFTAILNIVRERKLNLQDLSIGIIGVGNIGRKVAHLAEVCGMKTLLNDPPLQRKSNNPKFVSLDEALKADIITFHVPLIKTGEDKTVHLLDREKIKALKNDKIIINSSRGAVVDNEALSEETDKKNFAVVLDVWENEPVINKSMLAGTKFASPHAAGYSLEGKVNGTVILYNELCRFLNKEPGWKPSLPEADNPEIEIKNDKKIEEILSAALNHVYDLSKDTSDMKKIIDMKEEEIPQYFDKLRKNYPLRREFNNYKVRRFDDERINQVLREFRFKLTD